jgi:hypothetical protein
LDIQSIIIELEAERDRLDNAIAALQGICTRTASGKPDGRKRPLSAAARRKIGLAMKKRWAERKKKAAWLSFCSQHTPKFWPSAL